MFHNKKLQTIHDQCKEDINHFHDYLDNLSHDIKTLESFLNNSAIGEYSMEIECGKYLIFKDSRLQYYDYNLDPISQNGRPLIECKAVIRMDIEKYLPDFFINCMNVIKNVVKK